MFPYDRKHNQTYRNSFCEINLKPNVRKWTDDDVLVWKVSKYAKGKKDSNDFMFSYKDAYVQYNKELIINTAIDANIPPELLAAITWIEAGGMPEQYKFYVFNIREMLPVLGADDKTSFGTTAMQLRRAAETLAINILELNTAQKLELANCLMDDEFGLRMTAFHLYDLLVYDYGKIDTSSLTQEQLIMAGIRYNRGTERTIDDFRKYLAMPPENRTGDYSKLSYGLRIWSLIPRVKELLRR